jgi:hypothetical protein
MSDPMTDMTRDFKMANRAMEHFNAALLDFQACCIRLDWKGTEVARERALGAADSFMDNFAAGYKRTEGL